MQRNQVLLQQYHSLLRRPGLLGGILGAAFYFFVALGIFYLLFGKERWIGRVMSDWISLFSFVAFGAAMALLLARQRQIRKETSSLSIDILGDDAESLLLPEDARLYRNELRQQEEQVRALIPFRLLEAGLQRARANWSAEDVATAIKHQSEIIRDETGAAYAMVRYLAWAIPSIGFVGTVLGIGQAMATFNFDTAGSDTAVSPLKAAAGYLSMAFDTTFVALVLSLILMYLLYRVEADDDILLAAATETAMRRLPLRMHTPQEVQA